MRKRNPRRAAPAAGSRPLEWLASRIDYERVSAPGNNPAAFGLGRMRRLLRALGGPHLRCPVAHVAGTKGKGSTVAMLAAILEESGHRVGRYMSPHVHAVEERIAVDGAPIQRAAFVAALQRVMPAVEEMDRVAARRGRRGPTWFEVMTATAFVHFADASVDIAVLETGLGGRLDATNVCRPTVTVITSISHDHMKLLGPTIARIAAEKGGIVKRRCPLVCGATQPSARRTLAAIAARRRAPLLQLGRDFSVADVAAADGNALAGTTFELRVPGNPPRRYAVALPGSHQAENAALAVMAAGRLRARGIAVPEAAVARGLARATLPARIEAVARDPLVVVDAAHNAASMRALADTLRPLLSGTRGRVLLFAASGDKQIEKMLVAFRGLVDRVVVTRFLRNPRAAPLERLRAACSTAGLPTPVAAESPADALRIARSLSGRGGIVVVAGSFFLAAEVGAGPRSR